MQNDKKSYSFNRSCAYLKVVHTRADQLLPQLLMEGFDTLPSHYRYIGHPYEKV